jgi:hypothetical protein
MRKVILSRLILAVVISALLVISFVPVDTASAASNGQQLIFYRYSNGSYISWLQVSGTNQYGSRVTWSRSFSPAVPNHSLANWWWKGYTTVSWRCQPPKVSTNHK